MYSQNLMTTPEKHSVLTIDALLDSVGELAVLPQVVMRVIDLTGKPNVTATDIERIAGTDPALAAKILTLANSSYYGLPRRLSSLREAVVFLGFKSVRNMAMAITTFNMFLGKSDEASLARRAVWRHSLYAAQCARTVTTLLPAAVQETFGAEEAFTGGLLHDIGKMVLDGSQPALFKSLDALCKARGLRFHEVECQVLPFGHALLGAALAQRWNLPPALCEAIAFHHTPRAATLNPRLAAAVCFANETAHFLETHESDSPLAPEEWAAFWERAEESAIPLRIHADTVPRLVTACRGELGKGLSALSFG